LQAEAEALVVLTFLEAEALAEQVDIVHLHRKPCQVHLL
jgi:hypothetical protein